jgi:hypothetical protein
MNASRGLLQAQQKEGVNKHWVIWSLLIVFALSFSQAKLVTLVNNQGLEALGVITGTQLDGKQVFYQVGLYDGYTIDLKPGKYVVRARVPGLSGLDLNQVNCVVSYEVRESGAKRNVLAKNNMYMSRATSTRFKVDSSSEALEVEFKIPLGQELVESHVVGVLPLD